MKTSQNTDGYNIRNEIIDLCNEFFQHATSDDFRQQYTYMKQKVIDKKLLGLVLYGFHMIDTEITHVYTYSSHHMIRLTVASITRTLVREHFTRHMVECCH